MTFQEAIERYEKLLDQRELLRAVRMLLAPYRGAEGVPSNTILKENGHIVSVESVESFISWLSVQEEGTEAMLKQLTDTPVYLEGESLD